MNLNMRWMMKKDINSVMEIQNSNFHSKKFDKKFFESVVSSRKNPSFGFKGFNSFVSYVCELDKKPVGYIIYKVGLLDFENNFHSSKMMKHKKKLPMEGEIVGLCVHESHRLKGVGAHIIRSVIERFSSIVEFSLKESFSRPFLLYSICSDKDLSSHLFFKSLGFRAKFVHRDFFGESHDGYSMIYEMMPSKRVTTNSEKCQSGRNIFVDFFS